MSDNQNQGFSLERINFILIGAGALAVIVGFFLMSGGGADDVSSFSEDVFSFRRMYVGTNNHSCWLWFGHVWNHEKIVALELT